MKKELLNLKVDTTQVLRENTDALYLTEHDAAQIISLLCAEIEKEMLGSSKNPLASPLWRPLHDVLIDWNEGRMKIEKGSLSGTLIDNMVKGENNIKAVKTMIEIILQHILNRLREDKSTGVNSKEK